MKSPLRLRVIWSPAAKTGALRGMGLARVVLVESAAGDDRTLVLDARGLLRLGLGGALACYLVAVFALGAWLDRNPYNRITKIDLLLPWRWSGLRVLRAQMHLAQGRDDLQAQRYLDGIFRIRAGLRDYPHDPAARVALARLYVGAGRWAEAKALLVPELEWEPSRGFLQFLFEQAVRFEDRALILDACDRLLAKAGDPNDRAWLLEQKLGALFALGRHAEVLAELERHEPLVGFRLQEMKASALCRLHRGAEALAYIDTLRWPAPFEGVRQQLRARAYRETGQLDAMAATLATLIGSRPLEPEPWLFAIEQTWLAGRAAEAERLLHGFLQRFETRNEMLASAAQRLAQMPAPALVAACVQSARERGQAWETLEWWLAIARLRAGDFAGFETSTAILGESRRPVGPARGNVVEWMKALVDVVRVGGAGAEARLLAAMRGQPLAVSVYRDTLAALEQAGRWSAVEAIAAAAQETYPAAEDIAAKRELATRRRAAAEPALAGRGEPPRTRGRASAGEARGAADAPALAPAPKPLSPAPLPVADAAELWRALDASAQRGDRAGAAKLIGEVRRASPPWLFEAAAELDWREARLAVERGELRRVQQLLRQRLEERKRDVGRALEFVDLYAARQDQAGARAVAAEIVACVPESRPARQKLAGLEATPPPKQNAPPE